MADTCIAALACLRGSSRPSTAIRVAASLLDLDPYHDGEVVTDVIILDELDGYEITDGVICLDDIETLPMPIAPPTLMPARPFARSLASVEPAVSPALPRPVAPRREPAKARRSRPGAWLAVTALIAATCLFETERPRVAPPVPEAPVSAVAPPAIGPLAAGAPVAPPSPSPVVAPPAAQVRAPVVHVPPAPVVHVPPPPVVHAAPPPVVVSTPEPPPTHRAPPPVTSAPPPPAKASASAVAVVPPRPAPHPKAVAVAPTAAPTPAPVSRPTPAAKPAAAPRPGALDKLPDGSLALGGS